MATKNLISADDLCAYHHLEQTFIHSLYDEGLLKVSIVNQETFIPVDELQKLEKMISLHRDLEINVAGIASIIHLLAQMDDLHNQLYQLQNRLRLYED